ALGAPGFAVTGLADAEGAHTRLALVDLADSSVTELAEGEELWHPCLWVAAAASETDTTETSFVLDPDSAGAYDSESMDYLAKALRYKMEMMWRDADTGEILITGSSRSWAGVNPLLLTSGYAVNMSCAGNDIDISDSLAKNYVLSHWKKIKYIVVSLDIDILYHENWWNYYYGNTAGYKYDANHNFWPNTAPSLLYQASVNAWGGNEDGRKVYYKYRGLFYNESGSWKGDVAEVSLDSTRTDGTDMGDIYVERILSLIMDAQKYHVAVIGVIFPQSPAYQKTGSFGRYGVRRSLAASIIGKIKNLEISHPNFHLMDENKMGNHDYTDDMASNYDHLSYLGAAQLTARLDSLLKTLK
ncbi:MAG: TIGR02171 family protein, partial [Fibrobacteraceae bacterium]